MLERVLENRPKKNEKEYPVEGKVYSWTTQLEPITGHNNAPYSIALIKNSEEEMVLAQLTEFENQPEIGMPVEKVTRKLGTDKAGNTVYGPKYRPA